MNHKEFFEKWGKSDLDCAYTTPEEFYQAVKQRLIEELRTEFITGLRLHLIDTTENSLKPGG